MKLEGLEYRITSEVNDEVKVHYEFKIDSLELNPEEHELECKMLEKFLPQLLKLIEDNTKKK